MEPLAAVVVVVAVVERQPKTCSFLNYVLVERSVNSDGDCCWYVMEDDDGID